MIHDVRFTDVHSSPKDMQPASLLGKSVLPIHSNNDCRRSHHDAEWIVVS